MSDFANRVVVVTGATSGIGEATARRFAEAGARVVLIGRRDDRLASLADTLGGGALPVQLDVRDADAVSQAFQGLPDEYAAIDVLVNNAGLALGLEGAPEANLDDWETMVDTNVKGLMYCARAVLPGMVARDTGHIVNIGSVAGDTPYPGGNVYGASKAFVRQFSLNLRADLLGKKVRVTCVEPGMTKTEFGLVRFKGDREKSDQSYQGMDYMTGEDIADVIFYVTSLPERLNVNLVQLMPTQQAWAGYAFARH